MSRTPVPGTPRVVSLLPSATEILNAIGSLDLLVGRSCECDWPAEVLALPALTAARTTGQTSSEIDAQVREMREACGAGEALYELRTERLRELRPDVILTQDLCAVCSVDLATVRSIAAELDPVPEILSLDPSSIEGVFDDVLHVGEVVGRADAGHRAMVALREAFYDAADTVTPFVDGPRVAVVEWLDPLFIAGHWTPGLIEHAGGRVVLAEAGAPSRPRTPDELLAAAPDALIIAPCGFTLEQGRHAMEAATAAAWWRELPAVQAGRVALLDGTSSFSRPGPRLVETFRWLVGWLHDRPELIPPGFRWQTVPAP